MDRLKGLRSFVIIAAVVFGALRVVHVAVPLAVPEARLGPIRIDQLDAIYPQAGFGAILPAYRPASLGERPQSITLVFSPWPTVTTVWQSGDAYLAVRQQRRGPKPPAPPLARPFDGVPDSLWWMAEGRSHLVLARGSFWMHIETTLPVGELRRFADTLTEQRIIRQP